MRSRSSRRRVPTRRSQIAFIRGVRTAVRRILVPAAWNTASNEAVKFDPRSRIRNLMSPSPSPRVRARLRACCTVHWPVGLAVTPPRCIRRVPCSMNTRTYRRFSSTVSTWKKAGGEYPGSLGVHELPPGRARAARGRIDARGAQDLPDRGLRDRHAEFRHFAVDPAVSPQRILLRQTDDKAGDAPDCRRAARRALPARVVLLRGQLAVPGEQCRWRDREDVGPARTGYEPGQRGEPHPVGRLVTPRPT